jgi:hypothetical protein
VTISDNRVLARLDLPELTKFTGSVTLARNAGLVSVAWPKLTAMGALTVDDNDALTSLPTLPLAASGTLPLAGTLRITNNDALLRTPVLSGLSPIQIELINNDALISLEGFTFSEGLGMLRIEDNDALPSLTGLQAPSLSRLSVIGNDAMTSLASGTTVASSNIEVRDNPALTSLSGIKLGSVFALLNNDALTALDGLTVSANAAISSLRLEGNAVLSSLTGLNNLSSASSTLSIQDNPALPQCAALAFSTRLTGNATRTISGNNTSATCP